MVPRSQAPGRTALLSAHAGRRSAFSKAIIACVWRLETCEAETRKGLDRRANLPKACTCVLAMPINDHRESVVGPRNTAFAKV